MTMTRFKKKMTMTRRLCLFSVAGALSTPIYYFTRGSIRDFC